MAFQCPISFLSWVVFFWALKSLGGKQEKNKLFFFNQTINSAHTSSWDSVLKISNSNANLGGNYIVILQN